MFTRQGSKNVKYLKCDRNGKLIQKKEKKRYSQPAFLLQK